jgi:hypothetical protein
MLRQQVKKEIYMKRWGWMGFTATAVLILATTASAQQTPAAAAPADLGAPMANPVSATVKLRLATFQKNMVGGAELMPAEKYSFKPTPEMSTFGHLMLHIAQTNYRLCSVVSGMAMPETKVADTDGKDKLVPVVKDSFDFCTKALANTDDSKLGQMVKLFGPNPLPMAAAWIALPGTWNDHYSEEAIYLRLNGILPPSAQPAK